MHDGRERMLKIPRLLQRLPEKFLIPDSSGFSSACLKRVNLNLYSCWYWQKAENRFCFPSRRNGKGKNEKLTRTFLWSLFRGERKEYFKSFWWFFFLPFSPNVTIEIISRKRISFKTSLFVRSRMSSNSKRAMKTDKWDWAIRFYFWVFPFAFGL